jgi:hypothetical protein
MRKCPTFSNHVVKEQCVLGELLIVRPIGSSFLNVWHISFDDIEKDFVVDVIFENETVLILERSAYTKILTPRGKVGWYNDLHFSKIEYDE